MDRSEPLADRASDRVEILDPPHEDTEAYDRLPRRAERSEGSIDVVERLNGLAEGIVTADEMASGVGRGRSRYEHARTYAKRTGVTDLRLPWGAARVAEPAVSAPAATRRRVRRSSRPRHR